MTDGWDELRALARTLPPELAERLAQAWARDAQFEHASIASFGRFALELLAVSAPSELIEGAHRAAIDEIEHARLCFSLASIYAGKPIGPGALPLDQAAFSHPTLPEMVRAAVLEGCVNETLAAIEARAAHAGAGPKAVRDALSAIERQESDHAALAFRFVGWAVAVDGPKARAAAREAFELAGKQLRGAALQDRTDSPELEAALSEHGRIPTHERSELRKRGFHEVIAPASLDLLG